jgi:threonine synthase
MQYVSTRGGASVSAAEAIVRGICPSGGLYVPAEFPQIFVNALLPYANDYHSAAQKIMQLYLDIPEEKLHEYIHSAYGAQFDVPEIAPVVSLSDKESVLELWHGPTLAFKDMALQMLPYLMRDSLSATGEDKQIYILVATSGDTGKAALAGFKDVPGTAVQVFYPHGGVSRAQWLQMVTQEGSNVHVCGVKGNFDDAQTAVKRIFGDASLRAQAEAKGYKFSSANSINFGRLLPQIAYYFTAYLHLCESGAITCGDKINFCVPTGNFGDILAGYYAMRMGLPVRKLICASNRNNVLTDFFHKGEYDSRRPFYKNMSCSIDILVSSNLERLLFEAAGRDPKLVTEWMRSLSSEGRYAVGREVAAQLDELFYADWCDEEATLSTIRACFDDKGYLMDPHTAVGQTIYERYVAQTGDETHTVLLSTAHPFKFASDVLQAFGPRAEDDDFENAQRLSARTCKPVPQAISGLASKPILHNAVCEIADMPKRTLEVL